MSLPVDSQLFLVNSGGTQPASAPTEPAAQSETLVDRKGSKEEVEPKGSKDTSRWFTSSSRASTAASTAASAPLHPVPLPSDGPSARRKTSKDGPKPTQPAAQPAAQQEEVPQQPSAQPPEHPPDEKETSVPVTFFLPTSVPLTPVDPLSKSEKSTPEAPPVQPPVQPRDQPREAPLEQQLAKLALTSGSSPKTDERKDFRYLLMNFSFLFFFRAHRTKRSNQKTRKGRAV